jgi:hypothetical protein
MGVTQMRPLLRRARHVFGRNKDDEGISSSVDTGAAEGTSEKKNPGATDNVVPVNDIGAELPQEGLQQGVADAEAMTLTWSKKVLFLVFMKYVCS